MEWPIKCIKLISIINIITFLNSGFRGQDVQATYVLLMYIEHLADNGVEIISC